MYTYLPVLRIHWLAQVALQHHKLISNNGRYQLGQLSNPHVQSQAMELVCLTLGKRKTRAVLGNACFLCVSIYAIHINYTRMHLCSSQSLQITVGMQKETHAGRAPSVEFRSTVSCAKGREARCFLDNTVITSAMLWIVWPFRLSSVTTSQKPSLHWQVVSVPSR